MAVSILKPWVDGGSPSAKEAQELISAVEERIQRLGERADLPKDRRDRLDLVSRQFSAVKLDLVPQNNEFDEGKWKSKSRDNRKEILSELDGFIDELTDLNRDEVKTGKRWFSIFALFFGLVIALYVYSHTEHPTKIVSAADFIQLSTRLADVETAVTRWKDAKAAVPSARHTQAAINKETVNAADKARAAFQKLVDGLSTVDLSNDTLQSVGTMHARVNADNIPDSDSFTKMAQAVRAELGAFRSFLWSDQPWRWLEIALWAELGTLVGILFYIACTLSDGYFLRDKITMFWTEILITPVVLVAVFFLFNYVGITGIGLQGTSIAETAGLAFILGFAIRRTIGLLENLKRVIFREPETT